MDLKPGQIIIIQGSNFVTTLQGNTRAKHVCMVSKDPTKLWTTGAKFKVFFGLVDAAKYLKGKSYLVCEPVRELSVLQLQRMEAANKKMDGQFYGFWKFLLLEKQAMRDGIPQHLGKKANPKIDHILNPICSQAVGVAYWQAGIQIGAFRGKQDATALIPEDFEDEMAREKLIKEVYRV